MGKAEYNNNHQKYIDYVKDQKIEHYMFYGPISDQYWEQKTKILIINMEPYGYEDCELGQVDKDTLLDWLHDQGNTKTRTIRNSVLFTKSLLESMQSKITPTELSFKKSYQDIKSLEELLPKIVIYNIKSTSNNKKNQDYKGIINTNKGLLGDYLKKDITLLEPDIILVSGHAGLIAFKRIMGIANNFSNENNLVVHNGILISSIKHFSRSSYSNWIEIIKGIIEKI